MTAREKHAKINFLITFRFNLFQSIDFQFNLAPESCDEIVKIMKFNDDWKRKFDANINGILISNWAE